MNSDYSHHLVICASRSTAFHDRSVPFYRRSREPRDDRDNERGRRLRRADDDDDERRRREYRSCSKLVLRPL